MRVLLPNWVRVPAGAVLFIANTVVHVTPLLIVTALKILLPWRPLRRVCNRVLMAIAESWIAVNTALILGMTRTRFVVSGATSLRRDGHYLVLANHQSWVDIPVLQAVLNRRIPLLRFFLKSQLFWVPLLGQAWWALDFPFMKRYSRETLARHPELAGRDVEATRRACEKFRDIPVAVMNFVEGTRYTAAKHQAQSSPYRHLLRPRAGGVSFVLTAMGDALHAILDITIVYPQLHDRGRPTLLDLVTDRVGEVRIHIEERPIPSELTSGDYQNDAAFRESAQAWMNELWARKDATAEQLLRKGE
jgi:1-acyl-sn-glycerol-3-phosphate acyltransferase